MGHCGGPDASPAGPEAWGGVRCPGGTVCSLHLGFESLGRGSDGEEVVCLDTAASQAEKTPLERAPACEPRAGSGRAGLAVPPPGGGPVGMAVYFVGLF